jgi:hypothetical protein
MKKKEVQPTPKPGFEFTGWATFNWGRCHRMVFRTRKEAIQSCIENGILANHVGEATWADVKGHMKVMKVKCTVL